MHDTSNANAVELSHARRPMICRQIRERPVMGKGKEIESAWLYHHSEKWNAEMDDGEEQDRKRKDLKCRCFLMLKET